MAEPTSTQYDAIGLAYEDMKRLPAALLERENLHDAVAPYIKGATVLDLACGTGYYSRLLLKWGASRVIGVDISSKMVEVAQSESEKEGVPAEKSVFRVGDATKDLTSILKEFGTFDIAIGAWLLNYAPSAEQMALMFQNISRSLKDGGVFVGITPPPAEDVNACAEGYATAEARESMKKFGVSIDYLTELDNGEGFNTRVTGHTSPTEVRFENFHLRRDMYEKAAGSKVGMRGQIQWKEIQLPAGKKGSDIGVDESYWEGYGGKPHFGVLVVAK